jgi:hypothetical protein
MFKCREDVGDMTYKFKSDYESREELQKYASNALMLYALQLRFNIEDIDSVATESITDGYEDKKCDMIYVDENEGVAVIAQSYMKQSPQGGERAKLTKAQDLNTAAAWTLGRDMADVPELLKSAVTSLRNAICDGKITALYFWYLHNCDESDDIRNEMDTVAISAKALLKQSFPDSTIKIIGSEIGNTTLEK